MRPHERAKQSGLAIITLYSFTQIGLLVDKSPRNAKYSASRGAYQAFSDYLIYNP